MTRARRGTSRPRPVLGTLLFAIAGLGAALSGVELFYAYVFSSGNDRIPDGPVEVLAWFAIPLSGLLTSVVALRRSGRRSEHGDDGVLRTASLCLVALIMAAGWWVLVEGLR